MTARDCCFLVGYIASVLGFIVFLISFSRSDWMTHDYGYAGLWADCFVNETKKENEECSSSAKAEGPTYLELVRTFMILALVWEFIGVIGFNWCPQYKRPTTCTEQLKARLQELSYFLAGVLTMLGVVSYGLNYHEYYTEVKIYTNVKLGASFYMAAVFAGLGILFSLMLSCSRDTGLKEHLTKRQRSLKLKVLKSKLSSDTRKDWLKDKKVPTPSDQKEKNEDINDEIVVKQSVLKNIVMPTNVILAFNRLKRGTSRKKEQEAIDDEEREIEYLEYREASKLDNAESKYKGIFYVEGEARTKSILSPPSSARYSNTPTPRSVKIVTESDTASTTSSSSYSSYSSSISSDTTSEELMVTAKDGAVLPSANAVAAAVEDTKPPRNSSEKTPSATPQRQHVRRAMTTLQDDSESRNWAVDYSAQDKPSKLKPKRHLSHDAVVPKQKHSKLKKKKAPETSATATLPGKSIYSLPGDEAHPAHLPPPKYEEVIGSHLSHHDAPKPVMTKQSKLYQPYSGP